MTANKGLRAIAIFEATKGFLVLLVGIGVLGLLHRDLQVTAEHMLYLFRLNPAGYFPRIILELASHVTNGQLWWTALGSAVYSAFRFTEAYGLWYERTWGEWVAVISGSVPLPFEILGLVRHTTLPRFCILAINILVVLYVLVVMFQSRGRAPQPAPAPAG